MSERSDREQFWVEEEPADDPVLTDMLRIRREVKSEDGVEYLGTLAHIPTEHGPGVLEALADYYGRDLSTDSDGEADADG